MIHFRVDDGDYIDFSARGYSSEQVPDGEKEESNSGWDRNPAGLLPSGSTEFAHTPFGLTFTAPFPPHLESRSNTATPDTLELHFSLATAKKIHEVLDELLRKADDLMIELERRSKLTPEERKAERELGVSTSN